MSVVEFKDSDIEKWYQVLNAEDGVLQFIQYLPNEIKNGWSYLIHESDTLCGRWRNVRTLVDDIFNATLNSSLPSAFPSFEQPWAMMIFTRRFHVDLENNVATTVRNWTLASGVPLNSVYGVMAGRVVGRTYTGSRRGLLKVSRSMKLRWNTRCSLLSSIEGFGNLLESEIKKLPEAGELSMYMSSTELLVPEKQEPLSNGDEETETMENPHIYWTKEATGLCGLTDTTASPVSLLTTSTAGSSTGCCSGCWTATHCVYLSKAAILGLAGQP